MNVARNARSVIPDGYCGPASWLWLWPTMANRMLSATLPEEE